MSPFDNELLDRLVRGLADESIPVDDVPWDRLGQDFHRAIWAAVIAERNVMRRRKAQFRAWKLLRSFLTQEQRKMLRKRRFFCVIGSLGNCYRLYPNSGMCVEITKHGTYWFALRSYCLHDADNDLPAADLTLIQMLLLISDESEFTTKANSRFLRDQLWNKEYLRSLRSSRKPE